jgi:hypothetical protein
MTCRNVAGCSPPKGFVRVADDPFEAQPAISASRALDGKVARRALSSAGAVVIRSASAKLPPPDVFHFRHRFFPPTKGFAAACFIHEATWCSSRSSTDASSTPRVDLPIPIGVTGGSGLISVPRMNISFT